MASSWAHQECREVSHVGAKYKMEPRTAGPQELFFCQRKTAARGGGLCRFQLTVLSVSVSCVGVMSHPEPYFLKCTPADCSRNYVLSTVCGVQEPSRVVFLEVRYCCSRSYVSEPCVELFWSSIWRAALHLFLPCRCVPAVAARLSTCRSLHTDRWIGAC